MKNTVMGAMVGFLLAAAVVAVSYLLNDTVVHPDDVEKKLGLHMLASLPMEEGGEEEPKLRKKKRK